MDLSIIILSYKQKGLIRQSLRNLKSLRLSLDFEIIVVDNWGRDGIAEIISQEFMDVKLITSPKNVGFAGGNNLGVAKARGRHVLILNPDVIILSDAIDKMFKFMEEHPQAGIIGPRMVNADGSLQYTCSCWPDWRLPFYRRTFLSETNAGKKWNKNYLMMDWDHSYARKVSFLFGACLLVRKGFIENNKLFDERYFMYMEDLDLCRTFWERGLEVWYLPEAEVIHYHNRQSAEGSFLMSIFSKTARMHLLSWFKYFWKFRGKKLPSVE